MALDPVVRAMAEIVADLRRDLVAIMVEGDEHSRALARMADKRADAALRNLSGSDREVAP